MSRNASFKEELWSAVHCLVGVTSFVTCISADPNDAGMAVGKNVSPVHDLIWYPMLTLNPSDVWHRCRQIVTVDDYHSKSNS